VRWRANAVGARDKYPAPQARLRNRTQEADGSIPFRSTKVRRNFSLHSVCKTFRAQTFFIQAALSWSFFPPASTVRTFSCRALAPAPASRGSAASSAPTRVPAPLH